MIVVLALAASAATGQTLVVGTRAEPVTLDPHRTTDLVSAGIVVNVCEPLVRFRLDGSRPEPVLATTWATVDSRTWTFTLRQGVRFHDGTAFDADAVVANLDNLRRERAFPGRAERLGPHVVAVTLDQPNAALLATLSQPFFTLQSPRALGRPGPAQPVGTGPFRFVSAAPGNVELEAHPGYWGGAPRLARLVFRRYPSDEALLEDLYRGRADVTSAVSQRHVDALRDHPALSLDSQTGLNVVFLSLNTERPPFDDPRVRQGLARAIDRVGLVRDVLGGHGEPARNPLPPAVWGYGTRTRELVLDPAFTRRRLAEAGLSGGFEATLLETRMPRPYMPDPRQLAARLQDDLATVGVRTRIVPVATWAEYAGRASRGDYDMAVFGWQADTADPNDFLSALLGSESVGTTNRSRYRSLAMDSLLKRGRMGRDPRERLAAYHEAQELFQKDLPWIPLYHVSSYTAHRRSVKGLAVDLTGTLRYGEAWKSE